MRAGAPLRRGCGHRVGPGVFSPRALGGSRRAWCSTMSQGWGHSGRQRASLVSPCPSPQEIAECCRAIQTEAVALNPGLGPLLVLPLHPGMGRAAQKVYEVLEESGRERRVIVTHWLADSSFSLGTVRFVIDSGLELRNVSVPAWDREPSGGERGAWLCSGAQLAARAEASPGRERRGHGGLRCLAQPRLCVMPRAGGHGTCPREVAVVALHQRGGGAFGESGGSSAGAPSHSLACRSTTPASGQSPRCCGPSARARQSRACSEPQAAPQVRAPAQASPECASSGRGLLSHPTGAPGSLWPSALPCLPALAALSLGFILPTVMAHGPSPAGTCLRLYSEAFYEQRLPPSPAPHVSETSLSRLVLLLKRLDIADMGQCDFLDRPGSARGAQRGRACHGGGAGAKGRNRAAMREEMEAGHGRGCHCSLGCLWRGAGGSCECRRRIGRAAWSWQPADVLPQPPSR